ncbi:uncharacterized protein [Chelonus insularis]|uniref:uncharacterized protein n=1 Tax=Chelonus insularis TaxID=460826 RepID=UPI001589AF47|nr:uncharacterized protein LOC118070188 [Chelonus insularis]
MNSSSIANNKELKDTGNKTSSSSSTNKKKLVKESNTANCVATTKTICPVCKALLDSGSQSQFITQRICSQLQISLSNANIPVLKVAGSTTHVKNKASVTIRSRYNSYSTNLSRLVITKLTDVLPTAPINTAIDIPNNIDLTDPLFYQLTKIDLLLGAGIFWDLIRVGQIKLKEHPAVLHRTFSIRRTSSIILVEERSFDDTQKTFERRTLGSAYMKTKQRLYAMERKFIRDPEFAKEYYAFMNKYLNLGHMTIVDTKHIDNSQVIAHYLPHHVVKKKGSLKALRVVFDGSVKIDTGKSMNNLQIVGPTIQDELVSIILRFRQTGGRLTNSNIPFDEKHQLTLPAHHKLTELIMDHEHVNMQENRRY